ncbi:hypothetical protein HDV05_000067 [Chytridiales sp. JEL 0842]|nr:hypothetical protein HDV05_000067 [Chytridiales sp. JEL 0842]
MNSDIQASFYTDLQCTNLVSGGYLPSCQPISANVTCIKGSYFVLTTTPSSCSSSDLPSQIQAASKDNFSGANSLFNCTGSAKLKTCTLNRTGLMQSGDDASVAQVWPTLNIAADVASARSGAESLFSSSLLVGQLLVALYVLFRM